MIIFQFYFISNEQGKHWNAYCTKWLKQHKLFSFFFINVSNIDGLLIHQTIETHPYLTLFPCSRFFIFLFECLQCACARARARVCVCEQLVSRYKLVFINIFFSRVNFLWKWRAGFFYVGKIYRSLKTKTFGCIWYWTSTCTLHFNLLILFNQSFSHYHI